MTEQRDDTELWARAVGADDRAFGALFDRHHHRVFRHALRLVAVPSEADEVMASAFFELWRRRADVRLVDDSVLPWLLATTTYLARNRVRGMLRYRRLLARMPRDEVEDAATTATERAEQAERRRRLTAALREVPAQDAALIALTVLDGMTTAAAAQAIGLQPGAARMRLSRARGRLRALLADLDPRSAATEDGGGVR